MTSLRITYRGFSSTMVLAAALCVSGVARGQHGPETLVEKSAAAPDARPGVIGWFFGQLAKGDPALGVDVGASLGMGEIWRELDPGLGVRVHGQADVPLIPLLRLELGAGFERMGRSPASADGSFMRIPLYASAMVRAPRATDWSMQSYVRGGLGGSSAHLSGVRSEVNFDPVLHAGAGIFFPIGRLWGDDTLEARVDVTYNAQFQSRTGNFMLVSVGMQKTLVFDRDGDGIDDDADACREDAEDRDGFEDDDGCPELDNDGDQVLDLEDGCADTAEDRDGFQDEDGCPELDNDSDNIPDLVDACPLEAEDVDGFEDEDGCPELDNDQDGLLDKLDPCPVQAEDKDGFQDADGCPDFDNDNDGIADEIDACPLQPEDMNGFQDEDGCPDAKNDKDKDGIPDKVDACVMEPEDRDGFQDEDGCPDADNDGDTLADTADACPLEAEDRDGIADEDGCPEEDYDFDGIRDQADKCPLEAEVINGVDDGDGCPDEGATLVELKAERIDIKEKIFFKTDSDVIDERSHGLLHQLAALMSNHTEVTRVRIEGHTDDVGAEDYNQALSQKRAEAVREHLINRGIDRERLVAVGLGETKPVAPNKSRIGRELNRRVEFLIEQEPVAVEIKTVAPPPPPPATPKVPLALHELRKGASLESVSTTLWRSAVHASFLLAHNPHVTSTSAELPIGTVVKIPRTIEHVVEKGEGLGDIAKKLLGKSSLYKVIVDANKDVLPDPSKLEVGMKLVIPLVHAEVEKKLVTP